MGIAGSICLVIMMFIIFIVIAIPLTIVFWILTFPIKLCNMCTRKKIESKIKVHENKCPDAPLDDLLFVHGWHDCGDVWNHQVKELSAEYNCIVVTMPNYDGNED